MGSYLMGFDVGGSSVHCGVVEAAGGAVWTTARPWSQVPAPREGFFACRTDAELCWRVCVEAAREALAVANVRSEQVEGIAVAGMRFSLVLIDKGGAVLFAAPNYDARAAEEAIRLADDRGPALNERTGHWPLPIFAAPRLLWLAEHAPQVIERAACAMTLSDWLASRLTGRVATDPSHAGETLLFDQASDRAQRSSQASAPRFEAAAHTPGAVAAQAGWAWDLVDELGLPPGLLPEVRPCGSLLGGLSTSAADDLGLRSGTPVAVGGADTQCALLGMGVVEPGRLGVVAGSTVPLQMVAGHAVDNREGRVWLGRHVVPGRWVLESSAGAMGDALEWLAGVLYGDSPDPVARFLADAGRAAPGAGGTLSSFGSQVMNARQMMALPVGSLSLSHLDGLAACCRDVGRMWSAEGEARGRGAAGRADVARAVLEGMAFAVRANAAQLAEAEGVPARTGGLGEPKENGAALDGGAGTEAEGIGVPGQPDRPHICVAGRLGSNRVWTQLVCNVLNAPLEVSQIAEAGVLGAAVCAGAGAGIFRSLEEGARAVARIRRLEPEPAAARFYAELYGDWVRWRDLGAGAERSAGGVALRDRMERFSQTAEGGRQESGPGVVPAAAAWSPAPRLRILATAALDDQSVSELRQLGDVTCESYRDALRLLTGDELVDALSGMDVLVTEVDILDASALAECHDLRVVAVCRGRPVNVDLAACTALGVPVLHTPGRNAGAVADLTLTFVLMLLRQMPAAISFLREPGAEAGDLGRMGMAHAELLGNELWEKKVGLIGFGDVGRAVARRLQAFGARVLVADPHVPPEVVLSAGGVPATLDELLKHCDIVSLHASVTAETRGLINAERLARVKRGAWLINTARAALVDEEALVEALRSGHLGGAALDVCMHEPPGADDPLLSLPNVLVTPHLGGNTVEVGAHQGRMVVEDLRRMVAGLRPLHVLNPETLEGFSWRGERRRLDSAVLESLSAGLRPAVSDAGGPAEMALSMGPLSSHVGSSAGRPPVGVASPAETAGSAAARMQRVLALFLARASADEALQRFAAKSTVDWHYLASDLGLEFHLCFRDGHVTAGLGPPPGAADVRLKARAEVLDAILDGRLGGNRAAMTGKLSFSGDVRLAMGTQKVQKDLIRLYSAARREIGGIDFSAAGSAASQTFAAAGESGRSPSGVPAALATGAVEGGSGTTVELDAVSLAAGGSGGASCSGTARLEDELAAVAGELFAAGLITPTGGNASVRIPDCDEAWITPSQLFKGRLSAEMMVRVRLDGEASDPDAPAPSSERHLHCAIYRARPDVAAVVHTHSVYASIMGMCDLAFPAVTTEAAFFGDLPRVPFLMPGSRDLAEAATAALGSGAAVLLRNHGLLVVAGSLRRAADMAAAVEHVAHLLWGCRAVGAQPSTLPDETVGLLREIGAMLA